MKPSKQLQLIQKLSGKTQVELAEIFGVSFAAFNAWFLGKSDPRAKKQALIDAMYAEYSGDRTIGSAEIDIMEKKIANLKAKQSISFTSITMDKKKNETFMAHAISTILGLSGNSLDYDSIVAILRKDIVVYGVSLREHQEVKNLYAVLDMMEQWIRFGGNNLEVHFVLKMHEVMYAGILLEAGSFKKGFKADELTKFIRSWNGKNESFVRHACDLFVEFERLSPFEVGNITIGYTLIMMNLIRSGMTPMLIERTKKHIFKQYMENAQSGFDINGLLFLMYDGLANGYRLVK